MYKTLLFFVLWNVLYSTSWAQDNLVPNSSFEFHRPFVSYDECENTRGLMILNWKYGDYGWSVYYHTDLDRKKCKWGFNFTEAKPQDGNAHIELMYQESCSRSFKDVQNGCANNLYTKLISPLQIGKTYQVKYWAYIPSNDFAERSMFDHLGFALSQEPIMDHNNFFRVIEFPFFGIDSIQFNKWFEVRQYIRPTCPLYYLSIGLFRSDEFPTLNRKTNFNYYYALDNFSIKEISNNHLGFTKSTAYCKYMDKVISKMNAYKEQQLDIFFDFDSASLSSNNKNLINHFIIDSFDRLRTYYIKGFADSHGNYEYNKNLGLQRALVVKRYLEVQYKLPENSIIISSMTESEWHNMRKLDKRIVTDRKVEIHKSVISKQASIYRHALQLWKDGDLALSKKWFTIWLQKTSCQNAMMLIFDPRISELKTSAHYRWISAQIKSKYEKKYVSKYAYTVDSLAMEDQRYRTLVANMEGELGFLSTEDYFYLKNMLANQDSVALIHDNKVYSEVKKLIEQKFWPTIAICGRNATTGFIRILNHSMDTSFIPEYITKIYERCLVGENEWIDYCTLVDKQMIYTGKKQLYGNVMTTIPYLKLAPYDNLDSVVTRRRYYGLPSLSPTLR